MYKVKGKSSLTQVWFNFYNTFSSPMFYYNANQTIKYFFAFTIVFFTLSPLLNKDCSSIYVSTQTRGLVSVSLHPLSFSSYVVCCHVVCAFYFVSTSLPHVLFHQFHHTRHHCFSFLLAISFSYSDDKSDVNARLTNNTRVQGNLIFSLADKYISRGLYHDDANNGIFIFLFIISVRCAMKKRRKTNFIQQRRFYLISNSLPCSLKQPQYPCRLLLLTATAQIKNLNHLARNSSGRLIT